MFEVQNELLNNLLNFTVVILIQFIFLLVHAHFAGHKEKVSKYLKQGMLLGIPFGIIFDLIVGHKFGLYDYKIGFDLWFLTINGFFSYGIMLANVILLHKHSLHHMYLWAFGAGAVYEITNFFFPVWEWTFGSSQLEYLTVTIILYSALTWLMMIALKLVYKINFRLVPNFGKSN